MSTLNLTIGNSRYWRKNQHIYCLHLSTLSLTLRFVGLPYLQGEASWQGGGGGVCVCPQIRQSRVMWVVERSTHPTRLRHTKRWKQLREVTLGRRKSDTNPDKELVRNTLNNRERLGYPHSPVSQCSILKDKLKQNNIIYRAWFCLRFRFRLLYYSVLVIIKFYSHPIH